VFYEQYRGIVQTAILQLILSLASIFCVSTILLGMDPWAGLLIVFQISLIVLNVVGTMYWAGIDFNAISVVNLVMVPSRLLIYLFNCLLFYIIIIGKVATDEKFILFSHLKYNKYLAFIVILNLFLKN
jgi:hypothetical protein